LNPKLIWCLYHNASVDGGIGEIIIRNYYH